MGCNLSWSLKTGNKWLCQHKPPLQIIIIIINFLPSLVEIYYFKRKFFKFFVIYKSIMFQIDFFELIYFIKIHILHWICVKLFTFNTKMFFCKKKKIPFWRLPNICPRICMISHLLELDWTAILVGVHTTQTHHHGSSLPNQTVEEGRENLWDHRLWP